MGRLIYNVLLFLVVAGLVSLTVYLVVLAVNRLIRVVTDAVSDETTGFFGWLREKLPKRRKRRRKG